MPIQRIDLNDGFVLFDSEQHEVIVHIEQRYETMREFKYVELLNLKLLHTYKIIFLVEEFSTLDVYKNILDLDLDGLKYGLKLVYTTDFENQASSIQEVAEIISRT